MSISREKKDFVPAVLKEASIEKRWYIEFKVLDETTGKLTRKQLYLPSRYKTAEERRTYAKSKIETINSVLALGFTINPKKKVKVESFDKEEKYRNLSLEQAVEWALKFKKAELKEKSWQRYRNAKTLLLAWAGEQLKQSSILDFTDEHGIEFFRHITLNTDYQGKATIKSLTKGLFSLLVRERVIAKNPFPMVKKSRKELARSTKNKAFTTTQLNEILSYLKKNDMQVFQFAMTMLYTFARPHEEIRFIKIKDINLELGKIYIPAERSKNGYERRLEISPYLMDVLQDMGLDKLPADYYLFGNKKQPGKKAVCRNGIYRRFKKCLRELEIIDNDLTLYSLKHTGIMLHFLAGMDSETIKEQTGHKDWESFHVYLKSLNLLVNDRFKSKSPKIF